MPRDDPTVKRSKSGLSTGEMTGDADDVLHRGHIARPDQGVGADTMLDLAAGANPHLDQHHTRLHPLDDIGQRADLAAHC